MSTSSVNNMNRLTGMASNLDTESIVKSLMKASRAKVDKVEQQKTLLEWKKELYQNITSKMYDFQQKYFNSTSSWANGVSNVSASYNSSYISVSTSENSAAGKIYVQDIVSLATAAKLQSSSTVSSDPTIAVHTDSLSELAGKSIVVNLNGTDKVITFSNKTYSTSADVRDEIQSQINSMFGSGKITANLNGDNISLSAPNSTIMIKTPTDGSAPVSSLTFASYDSNRLDLNVSLASAGLKTTPTKTEDGSNIAFSINDKSFEFTSSNTLYDIIKKVNSSDAGVKMSYSTLTDTFSLVSATTGQASDITFADTAGNLMNSLFGAGVKTSGSDAVVKLSANGSTDPSDIITVTRSTNTIDVNGTTITLKDKAAGTAEEAVSVNLGYDTDALATKIKSFVDDYNSLLSTITSKISEDYNKDYQPLTDEQKEDMSEKEIELWETKAKTGLLRNDTYLKTIADQLKSTFYTPLSDLGDNSKSVGIMSEIGISTTNYADKGKLTVDETKLKNALNSDPEKVISLFTQKSDKSYSLYATDAWQQERYSEEGTFYRLSDVLSTNLNKTGDKKGALINLVGSPTDSYTGETEYSKRISDLKDKIEDMEDKLTSEENTYWNKFNAMETAIAKLNQQNSWLTSMNSNNSNS